MPENHDAAVVVERDRRVPALLIRAEGLIVNRGHG